MSGARTLWFVVALALASSLAIVGMLLAEHTLADALLMTVAAAPLGIGLWCWRRERRR